MEVCDAGNVGSAEPPLEVMAVDTVPAVEGFPPRKFCEWCDVVVLEGLDIDGGVATS